MRTISLVLLLSSIFISTSFSSCLAAEDEDVNSNLSDGAVRGGIIESDKMMELGMLTPGSLMMEGEKALYSGDPDRAIVAFRRSLDRNNDDADTHMLYAKALEMKIKEQKERDPELFNECIKEWLMVLRDQVGEEKASGIHGINPLGHFYEDEDHGIEAKHHLTKLVGRTPKPWETNAKYLKQVLMPATGTVSGTVLKTDDKSK